MDREERLRALAASSPALSACGGAVPRATAAAAPLATNPASRGPTAAAAAAKAPAGANAKLKAAGQAALVASQLASWGTAAWTAATPPPELWTPSGGMRGGWSVPSTLMFGTDGAPPLLSWGRLTAQAAPA